MTSTARGKGNGVTENSGPGGPGPQGPPPLPSRRDFDTTVAHPARVWDYWLGGKDNFAADREAAEQVVAACPSIAAAARADRAFLGRAVHYLAAEAGIRQFLDIGTGLPTAEQHPRGGAAVAPDSRIVYVDNDPIVLAHARALLTSDARGATAYIDADLRDTGKILAEAAAARWTSASRSRSCCCGILHFVPDNDDPYGIVAKLMDAAAVRQLPGRWRTPPSSSRRGAAEAAKRYSENNKATMSARSRSEVARFFDGLELVEPGITPVGVWRPGPDGGHPHPGPGQPTPRSPANPDRLVLGLSPPGPTSPRRAWACHRATRPARRSGALQLDPRRLDRDRHRSLDRPTVDPAGRQRHGLGHERRGRLARRDLDAVARPASAPGATVSAVTLTVRGATCVAGAVPSASTEMVSDQCARTTFVSTVGRASAGMANSKS